MYGSTGLLWAFNWRRIKGGAVERQFLHTGLLCVTWASMSVGMHVLNKSLVQNLEAPAIIAAVQMLIAVVAMGVASGQAVFRVPGGQVRRWMIIPVFFAAMLCTSFYAYERISLSLLTVVRNLTPLVALPLEFIIMPPEKRPAVSLPVIAAILVMLVGAMVYGGGILASLSLVGVAFALLNMLLAVADRLMQRRLLTQECKDLPAAVCTIINNFFGVFPTFALALATGQVNDMGLPAHKASWTDPRVQLLLVLSGIVGIGICYLGFECQRAISATSFFVLQNVSKIAVVTAGVVFFADPIKSPSAVLGLALSLGGSFMYGRAQMSLASTMVGARPVNACDSRAGPSASECEPSSKHESASLPPEGKQHV